MSRGRLEPLLLEGSAGKIFLLLRAPADGSGLVLFVPPFAEEMNKSRRQITETAEMLAARGFATLTVDLYGTGDSQGDFGDGTWAIWKSDVGAAISWAVGAGYELRGFVAVRTGCALLAEAVRDLGIAVPRTVFWQPVTSGLRFMKQFLRLRVMASMMEDDAKETVEDLRSRLAGGQVVEVAGYAVTPELWRSIERIRLADVLTPALGKLAVYEVGRGEPAMLSAPATQLLGDAQALEVEAIGERVAGEPFWSSVEIVVNRDLSRLTVDFLAESSLS